MLELLTAVAVTSVIITVLIGMTRVAIDAWAESRDQTKASRVAKESLDKMGRDLEGIVIRSGNNYEWAFARSESSNADGPTNDTKMSNPTEVFFFTGATDRYEGQIGTTDDKGGDVSAVSYRLVYQDQLNPGSGEFPIFALYRNLVNPDDAFKDYLSQTDLMQSSSYSADDTNTQNNFLVENVYDMTVTFVFEYEDTSGVTRQKRIPVMADGSVTTVRIFGDRVLVSNDILVDPDGNRITRLAAVDISILVLPDGAMNALGRRPIKNDEELSEFLRKEGYHYSKSIILPRP